MDWFIAIRYSLFFAYLQLMVIGSFIKNLQKGIFKSVGKHITYYLRNGLIEKL